MVKRIHAYYYSKAVQCNTLLEFKHFQLTIQRQTHIYIVHTNCFKYNKSKDNYAEQFLTKVCVQEILPNVNQVKRKKFPYLLKPRIMLHLITIFHILFKLVCNLTIITTSNY